MTDELTPEEREALEGLPRERMPVGLEGRVVEAMRQHGFLEKRRRVIAVTNSRVAGLLAACLSLMVGAYSIGLHRGGGEQVLPSVATMERDNRHPIEEPVVGAERKDEAESPAPSKAEEAKRPAAKATQMAQPTAPEVEPIAPKAPAEAGRVTSKEQLAKQTGEAAADRDREAAAQEEEQDAVRDKELAAGGREKTAAPPKEGVMPQALFSESARRAQPERADAVSKGQLTFMLNGSPVVVEAPDSVRVVEDLHGRMLLIYTSDGIIRIRMADKN